MKAEIKKKFDINRTGKKPIIYKPWEKLLLEIMDVQKRPVFGKIPGAVSAGTDEEILVDKPSTSTSSDPAAEGSTIPRKKIEISNKSPETDETKILSTLNCNDQSS
ncbi:hypothetical protein JTB14_031797 [Gonioctena quinquepunctata]|nr:hypothetical protein JTB14_031797 [Gonioctena quinquepunctata]